MASQIVDELGPLFTAADSEDEYSDNDDGLGGRASEETYDDVYLDTAYSSSYNLSEDNNASNRVEEFKIIHSSGDFKLKRMLLN